MSWHAQIRNGGIHLPQIDWWLDAQRPVPRCFVSHAHFDHLAAHPELVCSEPTARLLRARLPTRGRHRLRVQHVLPFGQTEQLTPEATITLYPAGHILGSAQALIHHPAHGSLLYTGDFKLQPGLSAEACATPRADVLIMETTFGRPQYVMPPPARVRASIIDFCRRTLADGGVPVLLGYSLGKSQEVLHALGDAALPVMLHRQALELTRIHEECGVTFPPYREFDAGAAAGHVVIAPPQAAHGRWLDGLTGARTAIITGWALDSGAKYRYRTDEAFPLSDHADFPDLLRFVERVQPRRVFTVHGFATDFARTLRERGIEAWALGKANQMDLALGLLETS